MNTTMTPYGPAARTTKGLSLKQTRLYLSAELFGANISWMLLAFILVQTYFYRQHLDNKPDRRNLQIIVYGLVLLQACETALDTLLAYGSMVYGWGDPLVEYVHVANSISSNLLPLTDALTGAIVQYYYIIRIWLFAMVQFGTKMKILTRVSMVLVGILPLLSCGSALAQVIIITPPTSWDDHLKYVNDLTLATWSISSAVVDTVITACMIGILYHAKATIQSEETHGRISRVLNATLQTGFITAVLAVVIVILLLGVPLEDRSFFSFPEYLLGKSYVISFLSILSAQQHQSSAIPGWSGTPEGMTTLTFAAGRARAQRSGTEFDISGNHGLATKFLRSFTTTFTGNSSAAVGAMELEARTYQAS